MKKNPKPELKSYDFNPKEYDLIVMGSPIWAGGIAPPLKTFIEETDFTGRRVSFFVSSMAGKYHDVFNNYFMDTLGSMESNIVNDETNGDGKSDSILVNKNIEIIPGLALKSSKKGMDERQRKKIEEYCLSLIGDFETEEIWDLYDGNRNLVGKTIKRGTKIPEGMYHIVVTVWLRNKDGKFLMSKRSRDKRWCPGMWEATGGAVDAGESSLDGAVREVREELGIRLNPKDGKLIKTMQSEEMKDFYDVWLFDVDDEIEDLILQKSEVSEARFMTMVEIDKLWQEKKLHILLYYYKELFTVDGKLR